MAATDDVDTQLIDDGPSLGQVVRPIRESWALVLVLVLAGAAAGVGASFLTKPRFASSTSFLLPQQAQGTAASALAALGPLSALAGVGGAGRSTGDQYAALLRSVTVSDRMIERFRLMDEYDARFKVDARKTLEKRVRINVGKKDNLITIEVEHTSPQIAMEMANRYVDELRAITSTLAITEAQQRRVFFEQQLKQTRDRLADAQAALQASGFNPGALKAEPKAAADGYAKLKAELAAAEVRLQTARSQLVDGAPEVKTLSATVAALRGQLARLEQPLATDAGPDYITKYREFKYQEALFEVYARQFELARTDESRDGTLIQVIDVATVPEKKVWPARSMWLAAGAGAGMLLGVVLAVRRGSRRMRGGPSPAA